jgi:hypothetical protein
MKSFPKLVGYAAFNRPLKKNTTWSELGTVGV